MVDPLVTYRPVFVQRVNHSQLFANCNVEALDAVMIDTHRRRAISKTTDSSAVVRDAFVQIFNSINVLNL